MAGSTSDLIGVTGATGAVGGAVVAELVAAGRPVVAVVRDATRVPSGVASRVADYADRRALEEALGGLHTLVFVSSDGEADRMLSHHLNVVGAAVAAGVRRIVYLSSLDVATDSPFCYAWVHGDTEAALRASGIPSVIVRAGLYAEFLDSLARLAIVDGELRLPLATGRITPISRSEVALALAAAALDEAGPEVREITGAESVDLAGLATGLGVRSPATPPTLAEFQNLLLAQGIEPWWIYAYTTLVQALAEDRFAA